MRRYHPLVFATLVSLCLVGFVLLGIASALPHLATLAQILNAIGGTILVAEIVLVLLVDWQGFTTLNGRINWSGMSDGKRFVLVCLACIFSPLLLIVYLVQIGRYASSYASVRPPTMFQKARP